MCYQSHNWSIFHHPCHKIFSLASLGIPQVIQLKHNFSWRLKNKCSIWECFKFIEVKSNALFLSTFGVKIDVLNKRKRVSRMCENAYLSIKNPKASRALKRALDPSRRMLASLTWLCFATSATFGLRSWGPPLTKSWIRTWAVADPGFSPGGGANSQNCYYFSHFCRKLHENERIWTPKGGARVPGAPPWIRQCWG